jgi:3-methylcrotonyl-CoA carboxylase alpha subunit
MRLAFQYNHQDYTVEIERASQGYRARLNGQEYPLMLVSKTGDSFSFLIGDHPVVAHMASDGPTIWVHVDGRTYMLTEIDGEGQRKGPRRTETAHGGESSVIAPMPGHVRTVEVAEGDAVAKGQTLLVLEAMKMEIRVQAPRSGHIRKLLAKAGQPVGREQVLAEIE